MDDIETKSEAASVTSSEAVSGASVTVSVTSVATSSAVAK